MQTLWLAGAALLTLGLTACGGTGDANAPTPAPTVTVTVTQTVTAPAPEPSPTPSPSPAEGMKIGTTLELDYVKLTPTETKVYVDPIYEAEHLAVHVEACRTTLNPDEEVTLSVFPWAAMTESGGVYDAQPGGYNPELKPGYPMDPVPFAPGDCLHGWMVFEVAGEPVAKIIYRNDAGETGTWLP